ncbi:hypothetical protein HHK36_019127 [Tetracentron sinense]|uniref:PI31 proteasome regulator N-terminal domain-containing protein n=1 Tax=Tetracentron sinense TaxID=13715 RepID=A0A834YWU4_TETSI|nr:hypothetical protein HHK36_019127 [Tetracentron sinense]
MVTESSVMAVIRASRPSFRNAHDKVAFAVHASFLASGYPLTATGPPAFFENALSSPSLDEVGIDKWNETDDCYAFIYSNPEKGSKKVLVKCLVMGDNLLIDALTEGDGEPLHLEIKVEDFNDGGNESTNYSAQYKNLKKLIRNLDAKILAKLDDSPSGSSRHKLPRSKSCEEFECNQKLGREITEPRGHQPYTSGFVYLPVPPIGGSDLFPGPGAGMYLPRGNYGSSGGILLGPNNPRWFVGMGEVPRFPGGRPGVLQRVRFDPYGPPGVPGFEPNRFIRVPRRRRSRAHPDLERFGDGSNII